MTLAFLSSAGIDLDLQAGRGWRAENFGAPILGGNSLVKWEVSPNSFLGPSFFKGCS